MTRIFFSGDSEKIAQLLAFAKELGLEYKLIDSEVTDATLKENPDLEKVLLASSKEFEQGKAKSGSIEELMQAGRKASSIYRKQKSK